MAELLLLPAHRQAAAVRAREVSARELLDLELVRVERLNPPLNAVVTLDVERARAATDAADAALARGDVVGPLHGVPMTIKDTFEVAGVRTTAGFEPWRNHRPTHDAVAVARLRAAGAVIFGKTNVPTLASDLQTFNPIFGTTSNPWDTRRSPGGSSGGAAAALATGLTALELGSDIGGSIRLPANWCGVCGHKPSHGLVPQRGHLPGPPGALAEPDLNVCGPLARSVDDLELALDVVAGPTPDRAVAWRLALPPPRRTRVHEWRLAAWLDDPAYPVDGEVRAALEGAVARLRGAGAHVDDRARPAVDLAALVRTYEKLLMPIVLAGMPDEQFRGMAGAADALPANDASYPARTLRAAAIRHRDWLAAHEARERIRAAMADFFRDHDALLMPAHVVAAIPHDHSEPFAARTIVVDGAPRPYTDLLAWIAPATMAWLPATVVPVGRTRAGLPVGVQVVGPWLEDRTALAVARHVLALSGGVAAPPGA
jgi:amidase